MDTQTWDRAKPMVVTGIVLIVFALLCLLAFQIRQVLLLLFLGVILGVTLNPFTDLMQRYHVPRVVAILVVYGLVAAVLAGVITYAAFQIAEQDFGAEVDEIRQDYEDLREGTFLPPSREVEDWLREVGRGVVGGLPGQVFTALSAVVGVATILFTAILFSTTQDRLREVALSFFHPDKRERVGELLRQYAIGLRGFARGELLAMTTIGVVTFIGLSIIGVRMAAILALIAFVMELLPLIGPWIAAVPALIVALTQGTFVAVQVGVLYLCIQIFENYIVTPLVHSRESEVPSLLIFAAITIGGTLMGVLGALIALPIAVILRITYIEVVKPWNQRRHGEAVEPGQPAADASSEEQREPVEVA